MSLEIVVGVVLRSVERYDLVLGKSNRRSRKQNTDAAFDYVAYDQVKAALPESQAEAEEQTNYNVRFWACPLVS